MSRNTELWVLCREELPTTLSDFSFWLLGVVKSYLTPARLSPLTWHSLIHHSGVLKPPQLINHLGGIYLILSQDAGSLELIRNLHILYNFLAHFLHPASSTYWAPKPLIIVKSLAWCATLEKCASHKSASQVNWRPNSLISTLIRFLASKTASKMFTTISQPNLTQFVCPRAI